MDDDQQAQFMSITGATSERSAQYLQFADGNVQSAIELFFANDGASLGASANDADNGGIPVRDSQNGPSRPSAYEDNNGVVHIDSDDEGEARDQTNIGRQTGTMDSRRSSSLSGVGLASERSRSYLDDDERLARTLQEQGESSPIPGGDAAGYRAPIARTTETLVGPDSIYDEGLQVQNAQEVRNAVLEQMNARRHRSSRRDRPSIFNQSAESIWTEGELNSLPRTSRSHRELNALDDDSSHMSYSSTTSRSPTRLSSSKANTLANMYRPPFELMSRARSWDDARDQGKDEKKWILVNIQDPSIFDCQVLNRDIWKNNGIVDTVRENFIFLQYSKDDPRASLYVQYYLPNKDHDSAYPHVAIVDPRTGEQVKVWSGSSASASSSVPSSSARMTPSYSPLKPADFLMQLHEFLDRYSLDPAAKNPVARRKPAMPKESRVERMSEQEQLEMAMQASLAASGRDEDSEQGDDSIDPDALTKSVGALEKSNGLGNTKGDVDSLKANEVIDNMDIDSSASVSAPDPFATISSSKSHVEPDANSPSPSTRIQFRHPNGRIVHRFLLSESVRRIFEWIKASPSTVLGEATVPDTSRTLHFDLTFMQKKLIEHLEETIEAAGLKNGTVMIELNTGSNEA